MIHLDTNVVLRLFVTENAAQSAKARKLFANLTTEKPGYISLVALAEAVWVLNRVYSQTREELVEIVDSLLNTAELRLERDDVVTEALWLFRTTKAGFSDCLTERSGAAAGCKHTVTFDRGATKMLAMQLLR